MYCVYADLRSFTSAFFFSSCSLYAKFTSHVLSPPFSGQILFPQVNCPLPFTTSCSVRHLIAIWNMYSHVQINTINLTGKFSVTDHARSASFLYRCTQTHTHIKLTQERHFMPNMKEHKYYRLLTHIYGIWKDWKQINTTSCIQHNPS